MDPPLTTLPAVVNKIDTLLLQWTLNSGTFGVIWCVVWMVLVADSPAEHPRIRDSERRYIESSIGASKRFTKQVIYERKKFAPRIRKYSVQRH